MSGNLALELILRDLCKTADVPLLPEYRFHPSRRWRFDYAIFPFRVAVEFEGGVYTNGAHTRGKHYTSDCEKYNAATAMGWRVFRYTAEMMRDAAGVAEQLRAVIEGGTGWTRTNE